MNYLRNLLRRLWPFVTRREHEELKTWVRKLESKLAGQMQLHDNAAEVRRKMDAEIAELKDTVQTLWSCVMCLGDNIYQVETVWQTEKPKKKPSRKKPAKKPRKKK